MHCVRELFSDSVEMIVNRQVKMNMFKLHMEVEA